MTETELAEIAERWGSGRLGIARSSRDEADVEALVVEVRQLRKTAGSENAIKAEREACAKIAEEEGHLCKPGLGGGGCENGEYGCHSRIAKKIRARGEA